MLIYPEINPTAFAIGPLHVRWYALAYLGGFLFGWAYAVYWAKKNPFRPNAADFDDYIPYLILGTILGGRLGYVLFYQFDHFMQSPLNIFKVWQGGMSFHGGLLGVVISVITFARLKKIPVLAMGDLCCAAAPIGLFLGRIANFVNGELWGRPVVHPDQVPWSMIFWYVDDVPRHPSQLYQAGLEGIVLFIILFFMVRRADIRARHGLIMGVFLVGYAILRSIGELFREPDSFLGYFGDFTMGQILSVPLLLIGTVLIVRAMRNPTDTEIHVTA